MAKKRDNKGQMDMGKQLTFKKYGNKSKGGRKREREGGDRLSSTTRTNC